MKKSLLSSVRRFRYFSIFVFFSLLLLEYATLFGLGTNAGFSAELVGSPDLGPVAESALLVVPENALLKGCVDTLPSCWLAQKVLLVRLVHHLL